MGAEAGPRAGGKVNFKDTGNSGRILWGGFCFESWNDMKILKC